MPNQPIRLTPDHQTDHRGTCVPESTPACDHRCVEPFTNPPDDADENTDDLENHRPPDCQCPEGIPERHTVAERRTEQELCECRYLTESLYCHREPRISCFVGNAGERVVVTVGHFTAGGGR